ncbi:unnamed protein product, partial [Ascophyllum nodosum]
LQLSSRTLAPCCGDSSVPCLIVFQPEKDQDGPSRELLKCCIALSIPRSFSGDHWHYVDTQ